MPWISGAIIAGGSLLSGAMSSNAAGKAADAQTSASRDAISEQRRQYDTTRADTAPYRNTGVAGNARLAALLGIGPQAGNVLSGEDISAIAKTPEMQAFYAKNGITPDQWIAQAKTNFDSGRFGSDTAGQLSTINTALGDQGIGNVSYTPAPNTTPADPAYGSLTRGFTAADLNADPVYNSGLQFGADQGRDAINARALATGSYDSGATLKALTRFGNDYGSTKANESYNRFQNNQGNIYNRLAGISGTGQNAVSQVSSAGQNMANNVSGLQTGIGNAQAASVVGGANAWGGAINNGINGYQNNQIFQRLMGGGSGGSGGYYPTGTYTPGAFAGPQPY